ncbi:MAG: hypothetical protein Q7S29_04895 [Candidatus Peribacter sp.]|nr:hypothetical protein [Candidatus Peribacter sp.]
MQNSEVQSGQQMHPVEARLKQHLDGMMYYASTLKRAGKGGQPRNPDEITVEVEQSFANAEAAGINVQAYRAQWEKMLPQVRERYRIYQQTRQRFGTLLEI